MAKSILKAAGETRITLGAAVTAQVGDLLGWDGSQWTKADADARIPATFMAMESTQLVALNCAVCQAGALFDSLAPFTAGKDQYLSATAGAITETIPAASTTLTILQRIGLAVATDTIVFDLNRRGPQTMRIQAAVDPASGATDTVQNLDVTLTGVVATDYVRIADSPAVVQGVIYNGSVVAGTDKVTLGIANASAGTVDGASKTITFLVDRF